MWNLWQKMIESFVFTLSKLGKREGVCNFVQTEKTLLEVRVTMLFPGAFEQEYENSRSNCSQCVSRGTWQQLSKFPSAAANRVHKFKKELDLNLATSLSQCDLSHSSSICLVYRNFVIYKWAGFFITFCINEPLSVFLIGWLLAGWLVL